MDNIQKETKIIYFCFIYPKDCCFSYLHSFFSKYSFSSFGVVVDNWLYKVGCKDVIDLNTYDRKYVLVPCLLNKTVTNYHDLESVLNHKYSLLFNNCVSGWKRLFLSIGLKWKWYYFIPNIFYNYVSKQTK